VTGEVTVYNLGGVAVKGKMGADSAPPDWSCAPSEWNVELAPMGQQTFSVTLSLPTASAGDETWLRFQGDFGAAGKPVLSIRNRTAG
jgi:hypothetical protein